MVRLDPERLGIADGSGRRRLGKHILVVPVIFFRTDPQLRQHFHAVAYARAGILVGRMLHFALFVVNERGGEDSHGVRVVRLDLQELTEPRADGEAGARALVALIAYRATEVTQVDARRDR